MASFDVLECAERLRPWVTRTPLVEAESLSQRTGKKVYLKLETLQKAGAFKFRGAMNYMLNLAKEEAEKGVITASSGNHGLAMSLAGKLMGVATTVVMPVNARLVKRERAMAYGATLILHGNSYDEAQEHAKVLAGLHGFTYVPSFNHPRIIEGQGTIMYEILLDLPKVDTVFVPVGGGGLLSGLLLAKAQLRGRARIVGVEPYGAASMKASLDAGAVAALSDMNTIADGVAVGAPGELNLEIVRRLKPSMECVSDEAILSAQKILLEEARLIAEPSGSVSVAGLLAGKLPPEAEHVVCVISGGNLDLSSLRQLICSGT